MAQKWHRAAQTERYILSVQAMDRAHRLGQKRAVNVYRLLTRGTLEERIMGLQVACAPQTPLAAALCIKAGSLGSPACLGREAGGRHTWQSFCCVSAGS